MKAREIVALINGEVLAGEHLLDEIDIKRGFSADLMSDVLSLVECKNKDVVLITGITNPQIIRTAEMLDIPMVIVARGKIVPEETINLAKEKNIVLVRTKHIVFVVSGILYKNGIEGAVRIKGEGTNS
ncbi:MAG: hypothetical protein CBR30_04335 [Dictyoglomus sp. NZ13-RE01]|nr:MAG: hypothetical protein CBR30_04335 [Dictyoglomus sp. NZ13-RE01]